MDNKNYDVLIILGNRIREQRKKIGWTQDNLAFESGLDRSYVGSIERGERNISFTILCKIATALSVDLSVLTKGIIKIEEGLNNE